MGPNLMNCCKPEQVGTKEHGKMLKRIQILEDGRVPAKEAINLKMEEQKRRIAMKEYRRLWNEFEDFMAQKGLRILAREKCYKTEVPCPGKKAMPSENRRQCIEEHFSSSLVDRRWEKYDRKRNGGG